MNTAAFPLGVSRDGNLRVVVIVKSCVNKKAGSWLAPQLNEQPFRGQVSKFTQLLTATQTQQFPFQVILVPEEELTNRRKNFNKVHCFSTKESDFGWCAVCNKNAPKVKVFYIFIISYMYM